MKPRSLRNRRNFLRSLGTGMAASVSAPLLAYSWPENIKIPSPLPDLVETDNEEYWEMVARQFAIPDGLTMVNAANLCPAPYPVIEKMGQFAQDLSHDVSFQNRGKFGDLKLKAVSLLSEYLEVNENEVGITRNTSEGNNIIVNGLDLGKGDEVIVWDQNHPTNLIAWQNRAKREGFTVKVVSVPASPDSARDLIIPFEEAITKKTRLLAFSHISNVSGIHMPTKEICSMARDRNVLTLVDGAQSFGLLDLGLRQLGCDFYTSSTHKWFMGPLENGILYMKEDHIDRVWPNILAAGWNPEANTVDTKFCILGQRNITSTAALPAAIEFHYRIGKSNIHERSLELSSYLMQMLQQRIPAVEFVTPAAHELRAGVVIFNIPGKDPVEIFAKLYEDFGVASAPTGGIRISPHIYNTKYEMEMIADSVLVLSS